MRSGWIGAVILTVVLSVVLLGKLSITVAQPTREQLKLSAPKPVRLRPAAPPQVHPRRQMSAGLQTVPYSEYS